MNFVNQNVSLQTTVFHPVLLQAANQATQTVRRM